MEISKEVREKLEPIDIFYLNLINSKLTIKQLSEIVGSKEATIKTWLNRYSSHFIKDKTSKPVKYSLSDLGKITIESKIKKIEREIERINELLSLHNHTYTKMAEEFLDYYYHDKLLEKGDLVVDYKKLEKFNFELADELVDKPYEVISSFNEAYSNGSVRFKNLPSDEIKNIRDFRKEDVNKLVQIKGVVLEISEVKQMVSNAVFECNHCGRVYHVPQDNPEEKLLTPGVCTCGRKNFTHLVEESVLDDYMTLVVEDNVNIENPQKIKCFAIGSLTNVNRYKKINLGDEIKITGVLRVREDKKRKSNSLTKFIDVIYFEPYQKSFEELDLTNDDVVKFKEFARTHDVVDSFSKSFAPHIYGYDKIKRAIIAQCFGCPHKVVNGNEIRNNIHILLVGDPGVAKSELLKAASKIVPKKIYVSGKNSSDVGLVGSIIKEENGYVAKIGALVRANNGIAFINEFDKMPREQMEVLNEIMEDKHTTISKAGYHFPVYFDVDTCMAANPKGSVFNPLDPLPQQVDIPATVLSRFDLIFYIKDKRDSFVDSKISDVVLSKWSSEADSVLKPEFDNEFVKKYIAFARQNVSPVLKDVVAKEKIKEFYLGVRGRISEGGLSFGVRLQEALIRLSFAFARADLSSEVLPVHVDRALDLMSEYLKFFEDEGGNIDVSKLLAVPKSFSEKRDLVWHFVREVGGVKEFFGVEDLYERLRGRVSLEDVEDIVGYLIKNDKIKRFENGLKLIRG